MNQISKKFKVDKHFNINFDHSEKKRTPQEEASMIVLAKYSHVGYYLLVPLLMGVGIGYWVDTKFNTSPRGIVFFIFLGFVSTIYNLIRITKEPS